MKKIILLVSMCLLLFSCKKEPPAVTPGCWTCIDNTGNMLHVICAENEQDAFDASGLINGVHTLQNFRNHCSK